MSHRSPLSKRAQRLRKSLRRTPPASIDLIQWLRSHGHANTAGEARQIIADGRVRSESHKLGVDGVWMAPVVYEGARLRPARLAGNPRVPASLRNTLYVAA